MVDERRQALRMAVSLPVCTTHPTLGNVTGATRDISSSGAYFLIESDSWNEGAPIEYVLQLPSEMTHGDPITVLCVGKVVRIEQLEGKMVGIAVAHQSSTMQVESNGRVLA